MPFEKGQSGNPAGKLPGTTNKATSKAREAIAKFVDDNADKLQEWLDKIAEKDPKQAYDCFMSVVEYHIPKLARTEIDADIKGNLVIEIVRFGENTPPGK